MGWRLWRRMWNFWTRVVGTKSSLVGIGWELEWEWEWEWWGMSLVWKWWKWRKYVDRLAWKQSGEELHVLVLDPDVVVL